MHPLLYQQYQLKKTAMEKACGHRAVERILYHGTTEQSSHEIWQHGFNRSFSGKNGQSGCTERDPSLGAVKGGKGAPSALAVWLVLGVCVPISILVSSEKDPRVRAPLCGSWITGGL